MPEAGSLRRRLFAWLIGPMIALAVISTLAAYGTAYRFANQVYDRWISDTAMALSRLVRSDGEQYRMDLPPAALTMLAADQRDRIYYKVSTNSGAFIAGHRGLPSPPSKLAKGAEPFCYDGVFNSEPVRVASYRTASGTQVQVAETTRKRDTLALEIVAGMLVPLAAAIVLAAWGLWAGVTRGLQPLTEVAAEIRNRSAADMRPIDEAASPLEMRPIAHALNGLLARLDHVLAAQRRFVADAAHQLRTPVTGLKTQAELALRATDPQAARASLVRIVEATDRAAHLVNQLLSLARAEPETGGRLDLVPLDLEHLMREVTADWIPRALEKGIDLGFASIATPAPINGEPTLLRELTSNLIDNALTYCPRGSEVTVSVLAHGNDVELVVEDNGPGVPEADRARVFERFHRVLGSGQPGSGLGLSIVREIARAHGGEARLDDAADATGTRVRVTLPIAA